MQLGVSLAVEDLAASIAFYEKLGFESGGDMPGGNRTLLRNGDVVIGLFEKMFDRNILTFNPGWSQGAEPLDDFTDVRTLHGRLREAGLQTLMEKGLEGDGPASFAILDPDGNPVLIDQHVPRP